MEEELGGREVCLGLGASQGGAWGAVQTQQGAGLAPTWGLSQ